jgi:uncharacterized membrane protein YhiD involved in acid resistance
MRSNLYEILANQGGSLTIEALLLSFLAALIIGLVIFASYRIAFSGDVYSSRFNVSLVMLTLVTTIIMRVIGNNIALSLGMVGALSIVRFRTAIKDPRDTAYIFWCIAVGVCCGASDFLVAGLGSGIVFLFMLAFGAVKRNERYLLIVHCMIDENQNVEQAVASYFDSTARLRVVNTNANANSTEYIYEISERKLTQATAKNGKTITDALRTLDNVEIVNLICQNDEINR